MKTAQKVLTRRAFNVSLVTQSAKLVLNITLYFVLLAIQSPSFLSWTETLAHLNAPTETSAIFRPASVKPATYLVHRVSAMETLVLLVTRHYPRNTSTTTYV
jgi:hypothetical protein